MFRFILAPKSLLTKMDKYFIYFFNVATFFFINPLESRTSSSAEGKSILQIESEFLHQFKGIQHVPWPLLDEDLIPDKVRLKICVDVYDTENGSNLQKLVYFTGAPFNQLPAFDDYDLHVTFRELLNENAILATVLFCNMENIRFENSATVKSFYITNSVNKNCVYKLSDPITAASTEKPQTQIISEICGLLTLAQYAKQKINSTITSQEFSEFQNRKKLQQELANKGRGKKFKRWAKLAKLSQEDRFTLCKKIYAKTYNTELEIEPIKNTGSLLSKPPVFEIRHKTIIFPDLPMEEPIRGVVTLLCPFDRIHFKGGHREDQFFTTRSVETNCWYNLGSDHGVSKTTKEVWLRSQICGISWDLF